MALSPGWNSSQLRDFLSRYSSFSIGMYCFFLYKEGKISFFIFFVLGKGKGYGLFIDFILYDRWEEC